MKYCSVFIISTIALGLPSCSSKQSIEHKVAYQEEYKEGIQVYQDTVNPQIYYQTDRQQVFVPEGKILNIKKSDTR